MSLEKEVLGRDLIMEGNPYKQFSFRRTPKFLWFTQP